MTLPEEVVRNFDQLQAAFQRGLVAVVPSTHKTTNEKVYVLCLITPIEHGKVLMAPWGLLFHAEGEDPRNAYDAPDVNDMIVGQGFTHLVEDKTVAGVIGGDDPNNQ